MQQTFSFNCPSQLAHVRKLPFGCGVKKPVLVNPGTPVMWTDHSGATEISVKNGVKSNKQIKQIIQSTVFAMSVRFCRTDQ